MNTSLIKALKRANENLTEEAAFFVRGDVIYYLNHNTKPKVVLLAVQFGSLNVSKVNKPYYLYPYLHEEVINKGSFSSMCSRSD